MTKNTVTQYNLPLIYGLLNGKLVHISFVSGGVNCNCRCPECDGLLIAKKGALKQHHFAHANVDDCGKGGETALHLAAKEIIRKRKCIYLPAVEAKFSLMDFSRVLKVFAPEQKYELDSVVLEKRIGSIIPDALAYVRSRPIAIEIKVSHSVSEDKIAYYQAIGMSAIEIDLSNIIRDYTPETLESMVIGPEKQKSWLFNAVTFKYCEKKLSEGKRYAFIYRGFAKHVDGCPIPARVWKGKPYANVMDDCCNCHHFLYMDENDIICCIT